jgi:hypothetical protein
MKVNCDYLAGTPSHGQHFGSRPVYVVQILHCHLFWNYAIRSFSFSYVFIFCCISTTIDSKRRGISLHCYLALNAIRRC